MQLCGDFVDNILQFCVCMLQSECFDGVLFNNLLTIWKFNDGLTDRADTCMLDFFVSFNSLFSHVDNTFNFDSMNNITRQLADGYLWQKTVSMLLV